MRLLKIGAALVVLVLIYAAVAMIVAPRMLEARLVELAEQRLGVPLSIGRVRINPFLFIVQATDVTMGAEGRPVSAARVHIDFDPLSSFFGRGLVIGDVKVNGLSLAAHIDEKGRLNFAEWAGRWQATAPASSGDEPATAVSIERVVLQDGSATLHDDSTGERVSVRAAPIEMHASGLSTVAEERGQFSASARIAGKAQLDWRGDIALGAPASKGEVSIRGLELALPWQFVKDKTGLAEPAGTVEASFRYAFSKNASTPSMSVTGLQAALSEAQLALKGAGRPLAAVAMARIEGGRYSLADNTLSVDLLSLARGRVAIVTDESGALNWTRLAAGERDDKDASDFRFTANTLRVDDVALHYADHARPVPLVVDSASLHGSAALRYGEGQLALHSLGLNARALSLGGGDEPAIRIDNVALSQGRFDLDERSMAAARLEINGGSAAVVRNADGAFQLARFFVAEKTERAAGSAPWSLSIGRVHIADLGLSLRDESFDPPLAYRLEDLDVSASNVGGDQPMTFEIAARAQGKGSVSASGTASQDFGRGDASVQMTRLPLPPLDPLVARYARVNVASGTLGGKASLTWSNDVRLSAKGALAVENLALEEEGSDAPVLSWNRLGVDGISFTLDPDRLQVDSVTLDAPEAKIAISEKREFNLAQLLRDREKSDKADGGNFPVRVDALRVRRGTIDFSDASLVLPFSTRVTNFMGSATGLTADPAQHAALVFRGRIGEFGEATLRARLNAFAPTEFADIEASFDNVPVPTLSPYSATFLGRKLADGRLWLAVDYSIDDGQLTGANRITIRDLKLGERVSAPSALDLPLDLAVALLTDSQGRLTTDLRVTGDVQNPNFNVGELVREAIGNLVTRVASAPFRAIARLFGGGESEDKDLGAVAFDPGSARIAPPDREKLQSVAKALAERPQLALVVGAPYHESDVRALQREKAAERLAVAMGLEPDAPVNVQSEDARKALVRLMSEQPGASSAGSGSAPREGTALFDAWTDMQPVDDMAGQRLAVRRAQAVMEYLVSQGVDRGRLRAGRIAALDGDTIRAELSLDVANSARSSDGDKEGSDQGEEKEDQARAGDTARGQDA